MTGNLDAAPLAPDDTLAVEHEGAALYASHLPAVHVFHLDHAELSARDLFGIGEQIEREIMLRPEAFV